MVLRYFTRELLKLTAKDMLGLKLIDGIISEPLGGAHNDVKWIAREIKRVILENTKELLNIPTEERVRQRIDKFCSMGAVKE